MIKKMTLGLALLPFLTHAGAKTPISLKDHYPQKYVVQEGDSLYEIAARYLNKPWQWRQIWRANPHIKNPKKLYPGTVLELQYLDGKPHLTVTRLGTYKLTPHARPRPAQKPVSPLPLSDIKPFLNASRVLDDNELSHAGYVVAYNGEQLRGTQEQEIYVKNLVAQGKGGVSYAIYRPAGIYTDPNQPKRTLGYKATFIGEAQLLRAGDPATLEITQITRGVELKDRVVPNDKPEFDVYFEPKAPSTEIKGEVLDILGGTDQAATNQILVLDSGKDKKLENGDVIALWQKKRFVKDPFSPKKTIALPNELIGEAMVFRTFTHTSFALVVKATRTIKLGDNYSNP